MPDSDSNPADTQLAAPEAIAEAVRRLRNGEPVAFPTETVYGLAADAMDAEAVARVFAVKGRPSSNPLIVHVTGAEMARRVVAEWTDEAERLAKEFWPGPLSLVLPKGERVPEIVTGGGATVAVRAPNHAVALALLEAFGGPLVGPSANPSGSVSPTTAAHVRASWSKGEVFVIDGGACTVGIESTVLGLPPHFDPPTALRPGAVSAEQIAACLAREVMPYADSTEAVRSGEPAASPGLLRAHYQPRSPVVINPADTLLGEAVIELPSDAQRAAAMLYASLREADAQTSVRIVVRLDRGESESQDRGVGLNSAALWDAILDRLSRASASS